MVSRDDRQQTTAEAPYQRGRVRPAFMTVLALALAVALFFFPLWSGQPIAEWFWRAHLWLPGWN